MNIKDKLKKKIQYHRKNINYQIFDQLDKVVIQAGKSTHPVLLNQSTCVYMFVNLGKDNLYHPETQRHMLAIRLWLLLLSIQMSICKKQKQELQRYDSSNLTQLTLFHGFPEPRNL